MVGEREDIRIDPAEAEREAGNALQLLEQYNAQLTQESSYWELASPSQDACRFCGYKAVCKPFWEHVSPAWDWPRNAAAAGPVLQVRSAGAADWAIEVDVRHGTIGTGLHKIRGNRPVEIEQGQYLRAANLLLAGEPPILLATEYSELQTGPPVNDTAAEL